MAQSLIEVPSFNRLSKQNTTRRISSKPRVSIQLRSAGGAELMHLLVDSCIRRRQCEFGAGNCSGFRFR